MTMAFERFLCCALLICATLADSTASQLYRKPNTGKGSVAFVSIGNAFPKSEIATIVSNLRIELPVDVKIVESDEADPSRQLLASGSQFAVVFVRDKNSPVILCAPEDHWTVVNVLKTGNASRTRMTAMRAFAGIAGGCGSQFVDSILNKPEINDLDGSEEVFPADFIDRCKLYLQAHGVEPAEFAEYEEACQEGWAPAPTNDVQKAIWDKVLAIPAKPMKIKFNPKKRR